MKQRYIVYYLPKDKEQEGAKSLIVFAYNATEAKKSATNYLKGIYKSITILACKLSIPSYKDVERVGLYK